MLGGIERKPMLGYSLRGCKSKGFLDTEKVREELDFTEQSPDCGQVSAPSQPVTASVSSHSPRN